MKTTVIAILTIAAFVVGDPLRPILPENTAYGYMQKYGIPLAEKIRKAEESASRIIGGSWPISISDNISPIALPSGSELNEDFAGEPVIASGFGLTADDAGLSASQFLSHVRLNVITNRACSIAFPLVVQASNICTSGVGRVGTCSGDSGGPVVATKNDKPLLVGIVSFGSGISCEINFPSAHARVTSFIDFINSNL